MMTCSQCPLQESKMASSWSKTYLLIISIVVNVIVILKSLIFKCDIFKSQMTQWSWLFLVENDSVNLKFIGKRLQQYINACTSQLFYFCSVHVVFGLVISGFEVIEQIENLKTDTASRPYADVRVIDCGVLVTKPAKDGKHT